ncbi:hypothetical protein EV426DRAFT_446450 [Tirmania nivea]|nr:hypothetical protein EV426DRAFT_446450 [Tirmania nivea]
MQEPAGQKLLEKRKLLFQEDMLMDFPDVGSLQTSYQSTEEKHLQWLHNLEEKHRIQQMRLRNRHVAEYQKWKEETRLSIDPHVILPLNSVTAVKEQIHESSLPVLSSGAAENALKREGREFRHVLVGMEQLNGPGEGEETGRDVCNVEFAAEVGRMGVNLRKTMVDEKIEMRMFQALEKEMVLNFLLKSDPEKYGKGRARMPSSAGIGGASGGPSASAMSSRPIHQTAKQGLAQANAEIGGAGLADMFDKNKPRQPLNIKIPPPPGLRPPGPGSSTTTPLTTASTATIAGDFPGLPSAGLMRDPRLASKPTEPPKDPRLSLNNPSLYKNLGEGGDGGTVAGATPGISATAASNPSTNASGKAPIPSTISFPSPSFYGSPARPPPPAPSLVSDPSMSSTVLPSQPMPPPPLAAVMAPVTSIPAAAVESPTQHVGPSILGMSPVTPTFPTPPLTYHPVPGVPAMTGTNPQAEEQSRSVDVEQTQGSQEMDTTQG